MIADTEVPRAAVALLQHALDTYASETNKTVSAWLEFETADLTFAPHPRSSTVLAIFKHQILSERRFFAEFLGLPEPAAAALLPVEESPAVYAARLEELARPRLGYLAARDQAWWTGRVPFFDVERERIWIFWRRLLHTAHHRTQLTTYLRFLNKSVPSTYGPTADVTWSGADPTNTIAAAERQGRGK